MFGPDLIKDAEEKVALIRDRLKVAQSRQKSYADAKRKEVVYEIGDRAYLRVSPLRGIKRFGIKGKLAPRFIGPYRVLARKGDWMLLIHVCLINKKEVPSYAPLIN